MMEITLYKVGGFVRDAILGIPSKDIDYAVEAPSYAAMREYIATRGKIYVENPEYLTIRAKMGVEDADFVLCRKEGEYTDGRRPDEVTMGTIDDDLARRDFTMNAIAMRTDGTLYDPYGGCEDIENKLIRCVGEAEDRFREDSLRLLRAVRFAITKGFDILPEIALALNDPELLDLLKNVSQERIREELGKAFRADTPRTLDMLAKYTMLRDKIFEDNMLWLEPTNKKA